MLRDLLISNRNELIRRCRAKVAKRFEPSAVPSVVDHGVPLFLQQLVDTLAAEQSTKARNIASPEPVPGTSEIGRAAALHGTELLRLGYSVDQVVHHYGDVCQAVTDLAFEQRAAVSVDEFRTLNRCLDGAIADAVTSYVHGREEAVSAQAEEVQVRLGRLADEQRRLIETGIQIFAAIKTGNIGVTGATGTALLKTLFELRDLIDKSLPEIRLVSGMTNTPPGKEPVALATD